MGKIGNIQIFEKYCGKIGKFEKFNRKKGGEIGKFEQCGGKNGKN